MMVLHAVSLDDALRESWISERDAFCLMAFRWPIRWRTCKSIALLHDVWRRSEGIKLKSLS
jgi:hypothetical protein